MVKISNTQRLIQCSTLAVLGASMAPTAFADDSIGTGNFKTGVCGSATSQYTTLTNNQATYGFGGTSQAALLSQTGSGTAGLVLRVNYSTPTSPKGDNFQSLTFNFNGDGGRVRKDTSVRYCFQPKSGTGDKFISYQTTLNQLTITKLGNGFSSATQTSAQFGDLNVQNMVLRKVTFTLSDAQGSENSVTIGNVTVGVTAGTFNPTGMKTDPVGCNALYSCPDTTASD